MKSFLTAQHDTNVKKRKRSDNAEHNDSDLEGYQQSFKKMYLLNLNVEK
jgi:hypothetical protein